MQHEGGSTVLGEVAPGWLRQGKHLEVCSCAWGGAEAGVEAGGGRENVRVWCGF